ncbi:MAG: hypothetical protein IPJ98_27020 [Bryobacterales bacterium]|nr:hypothetical protein [Bryobacterales bacterium]
MNDATREWIQETGGPPIHERNQEKSVALEMARRFDGVIVQSLRPASRASERSFWAQRQMQLDFTAAPLSFAAKPVGGRPKKARGAAKNGASGKAAGR